MEVVSLIVVARKFSRVTSFTIEVTSIFGSCKILFALAKNSLGVTSFSFAVTNNFSEVAN